MLWQRIVIFTAAIAALSTAVQAAKCPGDAGVSCTAARSAGIPTCKKGVVLAKIQQDLCDWSTGNMSSNHQQLVKQTAAAAGLGLSFRFPLPVHCWWAFSRPQGGSRRAAHAALVALGVQQQQQQQQQQQDGSGQGAAGVTTAATTAAAAAADNQQQQQQQQLDLRRIFALAGVDDLQLAQPAAVPAECSGGSCGDALYGMRLSKIDALWREELADIVPLAEFPYKGTIVDDGVDFTHADLAGQVDVGSSTTCSIDGGDPATRGLAQVACEGSSEAAMKSCDGHGSLVAGIMAGAWNNGDKGGIAGVVGPVRGGAVVSCNAGSRERSFVDVVRCIAHAAAVNASWVVNLSLGAYVPAGGAVEACYADAIKQHVCDRDGIAVTAAGNGRCVGRDCTTATKCKNPQECPSNYCVCYFGPVDHLDSDPEVPGGGVVHVPSSLAASMPHCVIAVAAVDENNMLAPFSNFGGGVRIVAPGVNITSDLPVAGSAAGVGVISGTSVATPHVSGTALLLRNVFPQASAKDVVNCLLDSANRMPSYPEPYEFAKWFPGKSYKDATGGLLNAQAAFGCLQRRVGCPVTQKRCGSSCLPSAQPCPCSSSSDCTSDETCVNSKCRRSRRSTEQPPGTSCPAGRKVCNGRCILQAGCCTEPDDCPWGQVCGRDGGRCSSSSSTAAGCPIKGLPACVNAATGVLLPAGASCSAAAYCVSADGSGKQSSPRQPSSGSNGGSNNAGGSRPRNSAALDGLRAAALCTF
ncbi:hypothetical protein OEZ85_000904 [Tetradesmus obliquus]|uniref:Peptidase S8/S53 domain-containing protein n=1 Tax=Tetradesmus obliquus TaxID=3088 RepID=A0ABY8UL13_TETOB|nr:hypothetical protein OEZ85_000904 [Tetradesmus obliquus]